MRSIIDSHLKFWPNLILKAFGRFQTVANLSAISEELPECLEKVQKLSSDAIENHTYALKGKLSWQQTRQ